MRKHLLFIAVFIAALATAAPCVAQKAAPAASTAVEFPLQDDKLYYEGVVEVNPTSKKADLYQIGRAWFVDTYVNAKDVLQLDDKAEGKMMGKGIYRYTFFNGLGVSQVIMHFTLALDIKDGKYRYRMYDFLGDNVNTDMLSGVTEVRSLDYNKCYTDYKAGKRTKYNLKVLQGMDTQVKIIAASLEKAMQKSVKKDDF